MIYENIVNYCAKKDISISQLEKKAGIGNGTIGKWQNGSPSLSSLTKVADALGVSVVSLLKKPKEKKC